MPRVKFKEKIVTAKNRFLDFTEEKFDQACAAGAPQARAHYAKRWAGITAAMGGIGIDYSIPVISLEYKLADPYTAMNLRNKEFAKRFRESLPPEELEIYLNGWAEDGSTGHTPYYKKFEHLSRKDIRKAAAGVRKGDIDDGTDED